MHGQFVVGCRLLRCASTATRQRTAWQRPSTTQTPTRPAPSLQALLCTRYNTLSAMDCSCSWLLMISLCCQQPKLYSRKWALVKSRISQDSSHFKASLLYRPYLSQKLLSLMSAHSIFIVAHLHSFMQACGCDACRSTSTHGM